MKIGYKKVKDCTPLHFYIWYYVKVKKHRTNTEVFAGCFFFFGGEKMEENTTEESKKAEKKTFTPQEMLNEINKAIYTVLAGGQSYQIGTRKLTRADLKQLYEMKNEFEAQVNANAGNELFADTYVAQFDGR